MLIIEFEWIFIRIPKKVENVRFHGRRPLGKPRLRWEDIRKDSSLLLSIKVWSK